MKKIKLTIRILLLPVTGTMAIAAGVIGTVLSLILFMSAFFEWLQDQEPDLDDAINCFLLPWYMLYQFTIKGKI